MGVPGFVDFVRVFVKAGDGGNGAVAFRREKYVPEGGPAGGKGGDGGSIFLEGDPQMVTLLDLRLRPSFQARSGANGANFNKAGKSGVDMVLRVPLGTTAADANTSEELGEVTREDERLLVARGGRGGRGNESFATATNRTPTRAEEGEEGEKRNLVLELKSIADVGLIGLPNAGKSTLLANLTNASPKIANYPFTTIHPNLGVMTDDSMSRVMTLADIPGLIEGAHQGVGLGVRFLRHVERTRLLVHLVGPEEGSTDIGEGEEVELLAEDLIEAYRLVRAELDHYSEALGRKPTLVCLNKVDLLAAGCAERLLRAFAEAGIEVVPISAATGLQLDSLKNRIFACIDEIEREAAAAARDLEDPEDAEDSEDPDAALSDSASARGGDEDGEDGSIARPEGGFPTP